MRVLSISWVVFLFASLLSTPSAAAQERTRNPGVAVSIKPRLDIDRESEQPSPPAPPLPWARASMRSPIPNGEMHAVTAPEAPGAPSETTVVLPLSAGLSVVSLPLRVGSEKLSDIFPNLPEGSRAWIWSARDQKFVEGLDHQLPLGHACWLYVPVPTLLVVTGRPNRLQDVLFDLEKGWNLIGVPYDTALLLSEQQVYVNFARKAFNDAVAAKEVDPLIYSFDVKGYESVADDGSFQPFHGYWVYARGAELLELRNPALSAGITDMIPWGTIASTGFGMIMTQMGYSDTAHINQALSKLDSITQTQTAMNAKLDAVLQNIEVSKTEILESIGDSTYVAPVQVQLLTHYDQENPNASLAWFVAQARAGTGQSVPMATKSDFARHVLNDWKFIEQFNNIKAGITPAATSDKGLLDNFADHVVLTSGQYDLKDRYTAMETYFSTLLGMQIKCATLIMNAYDQLGNDPTSTDGFTPQTAATWKQTVFDPVIKAETYRFLQAVESLAVRKLPVPTTWADPRVGVPDSVQVVTGRADLYVMETLKHIYPEDEPPGVRVRLMLNPGAGGDLPTVIWGPYALELPHVATLPSFDTWRTYAGSQEYDDWILSRPLTNRAFKVTSDWKVVRVILPVTASVTHYVELAGELPWWFFAYGLSAVSAAPTESGTLFGSITVAARPKTSDAFDSCAGWPSPTIDMTHNCVGATSSCDNGGPGACNKFSFTGYAPLFGQSWMVLTYQFVYEGRDPKTGTWKANADGTFTPPWPPCTGAALYYQLFKGNYPGWTTLDATKMIARWYSNAVQTVQVNWEPGQIYTFQALIKVTDSSSQCVRNWQYGGAAITIP
jgi:hypothetical protein